jgi:hypothetical protein
MFVASIGVCDSLAKQFGCFKHHGDMNKDDKHNHLEGWKSGMMVEADGRQRRETWIVATPGLITGYDYHRVEDVIFYEMGYGLLNLVQGGGRGGRSGKRANVIVITSDQVHTCHEGIPVEEDVELLGLMMKWVKNENECRRKIISGTMDGKVVTCGELLGAQRCDVCEPRTEITLMISKAMEMGEKPMGAKMPMEDIQMLLGGATQKSVGGSEVGARYEDLMDDMEFEEDFLIASLDLSTLESLEGRRILKTSRGSETMTAAAIAAVSDVGMNVKVAGSSNLQKQETKQRKTGIVD